MTLLVGTDLRSILCDRINLLEGSSKFSCRMIEPGIISYLNTPERDVVLIRKETIDRGIASARGNPLTIDHVDMSESLVLEDVSNGTVHEVRYNAADGWYYVDGVVETDQARNLIRRGYKPSCAFKEKSVAINTTGLRYHGFHYDKEITELEFHHLAIVKKPRFEEAIFRLNSISPTMNQFFLYVQRVLRKNKADGTPELDAAGKEIQETSIEKVQIDGTIEVEYQGRKMRMNDLGQLWMDQTKGVISDESEITVESAGEGLPECKVRLNELKKAYNQGRKNNADAEKSKKDKEEAEKRETERVNSLSAEEKEREKARKNSLFDTLSSAAQRAGARSTEEGYSTTAGSLAEKVAVGKTRY
jgi:Uncharacterized protein conserved in bacteria (DUF2213)